MKATFNHLQLKSVIAGSGKNHTEIHGALGIHRNTLSQWVRGIATPSPSDLYRVLRAAGWTDERIAGLRLVEFYPLM
jgi:transcriptional regulator with XRE-family HTH domain